MKCLLTTSLNICLMFSLLFCSYANMHVKLTSILILKWLIQSFFFPYVLMLSSNTLYMCSNIPCLVSSGLLMVAFWFCYRCNFLNFARNTRCLKCKTAGPTKEANTNEVERKKGDWTCPQWVPYFADKKIPIDHIFSFCFL